MGNGTSARIFNFNYQIVLHPPLGTIRSSISPCILERLFTNTYQRISSRIWINFGFNFSSWFRIQKLVKSSVRVNAVNVCGFELNWIAVTILIVLLQWIILCWLYWLWIEDLNSKSKFGNLKTKIFDLTGLHSIRIRLRPLLSMEKPIQNTVFYILMKIEADHVTWPQTSKIEYGCKCNDSIYFLSHDTGIECVGKW